MARSFRAKGGREESKRELSLCAELFSRLRRAERRGLKKADSTGVVVGAWL